MDPARIPLCFWLGLFSGTFGGAAVDAADLGSVPPAIAKQMRTQKLAPKDISLYVHRLSETAPRLAFNADIARFPASTIKVLTTKAALDILGPAYSWKTEVYATGTATGGRLPGDLYIKGYGNPNMTPEALWHLLWGVRERGVETIAGDLILDNSYFEPPGAGRGDFDGNPDGAYNALPSALSVNFQTTQIHLMQDSPDGGVRVFTDPPLANVALDNRLTLVDAPCKRKYHKPVMRLVEEGRRATLRLTGTFATECGETSYPRLMLEPAQHTAGAIVALWRGMGGRIKGSVREGTVPADAWKVHALDSPPLEEIIRIVNKRSNNLMARTLFLTLGAERLGAPGSPTKARQAVREWLNESGLDFPDLVLDNGSGLSRDTRISARSMGRLLGFAYASPNMPELVSSLAISGVDGTIRKRFAKSDLKGRVHAKTGTLRGATGIAGFLLDRQGERWIVISLINNPRLQAWRGKAVENALLHWVYEQGPVDEEVEPLPEQPRRQISARPTDWFLSRDTSAHRKSRHPRGSN